MVEETVGAPNEVIAEAARPSNDRLYAKVGLYSGLLSIALMALLHLLRPDLEPGGHVISEYSLGNFGVIGRAWFFVMGLGTAAIVLALARVVRGVGGKIGLVALAFGALGLLMAAIYAMDPITTPPEQASFAGQMHGLAAVLGNPGFVLGAMLLAFAITRTEPWASARGSIIGTAFLCLIMFFAMGAAVMSAMETTPGWGAVAIGWVNRLLVVSYSLWLIVVGLPTVRDRNA